MTAEILNIERKLNKEVAAFFKLSEFNKETGKRKKLTYAEFLSDKMLMIAAIRIGIPYSMFALIQDITPFNDSDWAEILDLSTKSLQRYKQSAKHFGPLQSEKIIEMAEVTRVGLDLFGDMDKFKLWLNTPNFALGSIEPIELLRDSYGKELVIGELIRAGHGIFI